MKVRVAGVGFALALLTGCVTLQVPYAPGPSFEPSVVGGDGPAPLAAPPGELVLTGTLITTGGQRTRVRTTVAFAPVDVQRDLNPKATVGQRRVTMNATGTVTMINTATRANPAPRQVTVNIFAGYPLDSPVCAAIRPGRTKDATPWTTHYCWQRLDLFTGTTVGDRPVGPGGMMAKRFGTPSPTGVELGALQVDATSVADAVARPADVIVVTSPRYGASGQRYRDACPGAWSGGGPAVEGEPRREQHVVVGALQPVGCEDVPDSL